MHNVTCFWSIARVFFWEGWYFEFFTENIKCGNLKKNRVIYHNEEKRVTIWLVFKVIFSNKIIQNYPQKGVRVIYPNSVVTENGQFPYVNARTLMREI